MPGFGCRTCGVPDTFFDEIRQPSRRWDTLLSFAIFSMKRTRIYHVKGRWSGWQGPDYEHLKAMPHNMNGYKIATPVGGHDRRARRPRDDRTT
jgi:hypothetical protein